ncbi:hypothetical protein BBJ28_00025058 [Nothophytophthora sp. Chile5]|nr:hypothetical protein BBJ28_00025058 [Nothophytophthora sp. Chile5]
MAPRDTALNTTPDPTHTEWTVAYCWDGLVDSITAPASAKGSNVRKILSRELNLTFKQTKVILLRQEDGSWPTQNDATSCQGEELKYLLPVRGQLEDLVDVDAVQIRVETPLSAPEAIPALDFDFSTVAAVAVGYESTTDSVVSKLNGAFCRCRKRKASGQAVSSVAYSSVNAAFMEEMTKDVKKAKFEQDAMLLPAAYLKRLQVKYKELVMTCKEPWMQSESQRRLYIDSVLTTCMAAVKDDDKSKAELFLHTERPINHDANWIFVKRSSKLFETEHLVTRTPQTMHWNPEEFSKDMIKIANRVYTMLKLL